MRSRLSIKTIILITLLWILPSVWVFSQSSRNTEQKLAWLNTYCDKLKGIPTGTENYPQLIIESKKGLKITPSTNLFYKSVFAFHLGGGYESTFKMDSAIHYYELSKKYAEKAKNNSRIVYALRRLAGLYDNKQLPTEASKIRNQLIEIAKVDKDENIQVGANIVLGEYYFNSGMFEKALKSYLEYIKYLKIDYNKNTNTPSPSNIGVGYLAVGEIYQNLNRPNESLAYFKESLAYFNTYREGLENAYKDLVTSYVSLNRIDSAQQFYSKLKQSVTQSGDVTLLIDAQVELGKGFIAGNSLDKATTILREAERNLALSNEKEDLYSVKLAIGDLLLKKGESRTAISYYKEALPLALYFKSKAAIARLYLNWQKPKNRTI